MEEKGITVGELCPVLNKQHGRGVMLQQLLKVLIYYAFTSLFLHHFSLLLFFKYLSLLSCVSLLLIRNFLDLDKHSAERKNKGVSQELWENC